MDTTAGNLLFDTSYTFSLTPQEALFMMFISMYCDQKGVFLRWVQSSEPLIISKNTVCVTNCGRQQVNRIFFTGIMSVNLFMIRMP